MSERQIRAIQYSARCAKRRQREAERRKARITKVINTIVPFAVGVLAVSLLIVSAV